MNNPFSTFACSTAAVATLGATLVLSGCASPMANKAIWGKPQELVAAISSGQITDVNAYLPDIGDDPISPLCALMASPDQEATVDLLLARGAKVNQVCRKDGKTMPLEAVRKSAVAAGTIDGLYGTGERWLYPHHVPSFLRYANKLVAKGARTAIGREFTQQEVVEWITDEIKKDISLIAFTNENYEKLHGKKSDSGSLFSASNLATVVAVAGVAIAAKSASNAQAATAALPLAKVTPFPPANTAAPKTSAAASGVVSAPAKSAPSVAAAASAAPVIGAENVKIAPNLYSSSLNSQAANANSPAAQLGAKLAGVSLDFDKESSAGSGSTSTYRDTTTPTSAAQPVATPAKKAKAVEWGDIKLESVAVCRQNTKTKLWTCNGALDNQIIVDEPTVESALKRQRCNNPEQMTVTPIIEGVPWQSYRCGHSLGFGDYDVGKKYNLTAVQRRYICPKNQLGDGRCETLYDGQDKR